MLSPSSPNPDMFMTVSALPEMESYTNGSGISCSALVSKLAWQTPAVLSLQESDLIITSRFSLHDSLLLTEVFYLVQHLGMTFNLLDWVLPESIFAQTHSKTFLFASVYQSTVQ